MLVSNRGAASLVVGVMIATGVSACSPSGHGPRSTGEQVQQMASADSGQAVVDALAKRLALAEQRLADDLAPLGGLSEFNPYLAAVSKADAGTSSSLATARARLAAMDCNGVARSLAALRTANGRLGGAVTTLNARISQVTASTTKILADRDDVLDAQASLEAALKAHPSAWVGQDGAPLQDMLTAIAHWQSSLADTVAGARGAAVAKSSRVNAVSASASKLTSACRTSSSQARKPPPALGGNGSVGGTVVVQPVVRPITPPRPPVTTPPTAHPTIPASPGYTPSPTPSEEPTQDPTESPTQDPTESPTQDPTESPTQDPTEEPSATPSSQETPTDDPTDDPSIYASDTPTPVPAP